MKTLFGYMKIAFWSPTLKSNRQNRLEKFIYKKSDKK